MNLYSASKVETILVTYKDGIRTLIVCNIYSSKHIAERISEIDFEKAGLDDVTRRIDFTLEYDYDTCQVLLPPNNNFKATREVYIPYNYSLGEDEEEEDIKKYYPNYSLNFH